jgi:hypothetical protein
MIWDTLANVQLTMLIRLTTNTQKGGGNENRGDSNKR